jgi:hypothetical protein
MLNDSSDATIIVSAPEAVQLSGAPLDGSFTITCQDENAIDWTTEDIWFSWGEATVQKLITSSIPFLADKIEVLRTNKYPYVQNGVEYVINFRDVLADVPQCTIQTSTGENPLTGENPTYVATTTHDYGTNLYFEPIPLEMMRFPASAPQIEVLVDGIPALCPNFNCEFAYIEAVGEITGQTVTGTSVSITGTNLPTTGFTVTIADQECDTGSHNAIETEITCSLTEVPVAGNTNAVVKTDQGVVAIADGVAEIEIDITVTTVSTA